MQQFIINTMHNQPLVNPSPLNLYALFNIIHITSTPHSSKAAITVNGKIPNIGLVQMLLKFNYTYPTMIDKIYLVD